MRALALHWLAATAALSLLGACAGQPSAPAATAAAPADPLLASEAQRRGYAVGYNTGTRVQLMKAYLSLPDFDQAVDDAWQNRLPRLNAEERDRASSEVASRARAGLAPAQDDLAARFSYAIGLDVGANLKPVQERLDEPSLRAGIEDGVQQRPPRLDQAAREQALAPLVAELHARRAQTLHDSEVRAETFLAANARRPGVITTASGLQYEVLKQGRGRLPSADSRITVHYTGSLADGQVFDDSRGRGQPASFILGKTLKGFVEGVELMPVGSRYRLVLPPALAYGDRGAPPKIDPNEVLVFDVELIATE